MMHHHTKAGYKTMNDAEDILWTKRDTGADRQQDMVI